MYTPYFEHLTDVDWMFIRKYLAITIRSVLNLHKNNIHRIVGILRTDLVEICLHNFAQVPENQTISGNFQRLRAFKEAAIKTASHTRLLNLQHTFDRHE
jgi:hypothetical protein